MGDEPPPPPPSPPPPQKYRLSELCCQQKKSVEPWFAMSNSLLSGVKCLCIFDKHLAILLSSNVGSPYGGTGLKIVKKPNISRIANHLTRVPLPPKGFALIHSHWFGYVVGCMFVANSKPSSLRVSRWWCHSCIMHIPSSHTFIYLISQSAHIGN